MMQYRQGFGFVDLWRVNLQESYAQIQIIISAHVRQLSVVPANSVSKTNLEEKDSKQDDAPW